MQLKRGNPGQNLGYDRCSYLSFSVTGIKKDEIFKSTGRRDLNIKYTNFNQWKRWVENKLKDITGEKLPTTFEMVIVKDA